MKKYAFGVDIGGTTVKLGLFETNGNILDSWEIDTRTENDGEYILSDIAEAIKESMQNYGVSVEELQGIGVGVPGPVIEDGTVLKCVNLGWDIFNVEQRMQSLTGVRVKASNDANIAALGEIWQGGGCGYRNVVMVTLGTGVGCGIILNGKIHAGSTGSAGEIGHMVVSDEEEEYCTCGKKGCLEQYSSATGVVRVAKRYFSAHPEKETPLRYMKSFTAKDIFDMAKRDDEASIAIIEEITNTLGKALANICTVLNPEVVLIGGGMSKAGPILLERIRKYYRKYAFHASREIEIKLATLGNQAGIFGGARLVIDE